MKKYLINEVVTAKQMTLADARNNAANIKIYSESDDGNEVGFLVCHTSTCIFEWVPKKSFKAVPFDNYQEIFNEYLLTTERIMDKMKEFSKSQKPYSDCRKMVYAINRHIRGINKNLTGIIKQLKQK